MRLAEWAKKHAEEISEIPEAENVLNAIVKKMEELGYSALADNDKEPEYTERKEAEKKITGLQEKNTELEQKYSNLVIESAIKLRAVQEHAKDAEDLAKLIDRGKLKFTENGIEGLDEQIKSLKEAKPYLFGDTKIIEGANPAGDNTTKPVTLETAVREHYKL